MDISVISLIIASVSALATILTALHLKHCKSACCEADFYKTKSVPDTPTVNVKTDLT
jgi:hypothetical protein